MKTYRYVFWGKLRSSAVSWADSHLGQVKVDVYAQSEEQAEAKLNVLYEPYYGFGTPEVVAVHGGVT